MGGLAAREYIHSSFLGHEKVDKVITLATPHLGSHWVEKAYSIKRFQKGGWINQGIMFAVSIGILSLDSSLEFIADIDLDGDAVSDMDPGGLYLNELNQLTQPEDVDYYAICGNIWYHYAANEIGDGVVSISSQKGEGILNVKSSITVRANHVNAPKILGEDESNILISFLDDVTPYVYITQPTVDENGEFDSVDTQVVIQGQVKEEYLPADCELTIEYREAGTEAWIEWVFGDGNKKRLKPSDLWQTEKVVAEFEETITLPDTDIDYQIKVSVKNPAGLTGSNVIGSKIECQC